MHQRQHFSIDAFRSMTTFGHSMWATPFSTETWDGLDNVPKLLQVYNDLGDRDEIERDWYGERPVKARIYTEGIARRTNMYTKETPTYSLYVVSIPLTMLDSKFDDIADKVKEVQKAAIERCMDCAEHYGIPLTVDRKIRFNYSRHMWDANWEKPYSMDVKLEELHA